MKLDRLTDIKISIEYALLPNDGTAAQLIDEIRHEIPEIDGEVDEEGHCSLFARNKIWYVGAKIGEKTHIGFVQGFNVRSGNLSFEYGEHGEIVEPLQLEHQVRWGMKRK